MAVLWDNFLAGTITNNPLAIGGTTLNSAELASMPVVSGDTMWVILDPRSLSAGREIVSVTAHTSSATSATIVRAQQGTSALTHPAGTEWVVGVTKSDLESFFLKSGGTLTGPIVLPAGTTGAGTAPIKLTAGTNMTAAEAGAIEWDGTNLFVSQTTGPTRKTIAYTDSNITGSAATAAQWTTARSVSFSGGDVTGTFLIDGSAHVSSVVLSLVAGTIVNNGINASAGIVDTKLDTISTANKVSLAALDIDGATDIGGALADADLIVVDDGAAGTNRKSALSRVATWLFAKVSGDITTDSSGVAAIGTGVIVNADVNASAGIVDTKLATISTANKVGLAALDIDGGTDIGGALADADLIIVDDGAGGTNRKSALSRVATWLFAKVSSHATVSSTGVLTLASNILTNAMLSNAAGQPGADMLTSTYTPEITATSINYGTGVSRSGEYIQIGKIVIGRANLTLGTTSFNKGSGTYEFGIPVAPLTTGNSTALCLGVLRVSGMTSGHIATFSVPIILNGNGMQFRYPGAYPNGAQAIVGSDSPVAVIASQRFEWFFCYEVD